MGTSCPLCRHPVPSGALGTSEAVPMWGPRVPFDVTLRPRGQVELCPCGGTVFPSPSPCAIWVVGDKRGCACVGPHVPFAITLRLWGHGGTRRALPTWGSVSPPPSPRTLEEHVRTRGALPMWEPHVPKPPPLGVRGDKKGSAYMGTPGLWGRGGPTGTANPKAPPLQQGWGGGVNAPPNPI